MRRAQHNLLTTELQFLQHVTDGEHRLLLRSAQQCCTGHRACQTRASLVCGMLRSPTRPHLQLPLLRPFADAAA